MPRHGTWVARVRLLESALACLTLASLAAPRPAHALPPWRERYLATLRQCRTADAHECRDSLAALRGLLPGHPGVVYALARASMRAADRAGALHSLDAYASMGLTLEIARDSVFAPLTGDPEWARITRRLAANAAPLASARLMHRLDDGGLLTEDVAWDAQRRVWLVSSIHQRRIVTVDERGHEADFLAPGQARPWGVFALGVDRERRRLWAGTAATAEMDSVRDAERGRAALACYDLDRGTLIRRWELTAPGPSHVLGDMTLGPAGEVYVTDSVAGGVYGASIDVDSLETLLPPGSLVSPQTPVLVPGGKRLLIPDYSRGLAVLDLKTRQLRWLAQPADLAMAGTDGLYLWKDGLVAIQNGVDPHRVVALGMDANFERIVGWRVLEQGSPFLGEPNHGVMMGDRLVFIGNSGWERVDDDGHLRADAHTLPPALLELRLK